MLSLSFSSISNQWFGESNKLVAAIFTLARKIAPTIIFIDEVDCFLTSRSSGRVGSEAMVHIMQEFLTSMDGLVASSTSGLAESKPVIVIGATNRLEDVDGAILRRLPTVLTFPLPAPDDRAVRYGSSMPFFKKIIMLWWCCCCCCL